MNRMLALTVAFALMVGQFLSISAQVQGTGIITGTLGGPSGALAGVTMQVVNAEGTVVGTTVTNSVGTFQWTGLNPGTFTVQAVGANGAVVGVSSATLAQGAMSVAVSVQATAGAAAAAAVGAGAAAATGSALTTTTVLTAAGVAAGAAGVGAVIATQDDASGSR